MLRRPLLVLDAYLEDDPRPSWEPLLARATRPVTWVRASRGGSWLGPLDRYAAVIQTGSAACLPDGVSWAPAVIEAVREVVSRSVPYLGVCWGHQVLAEAIGGPGTVVKRALPEVGVRTVTVHDPADPVVGALGTAFEVMISHEDEVGLPVPGGLTVLASSAECPTHALRVQGKPAWGVQFHPEMRRQEVAGLLGRRARKHPALGLDPKEELVRYDRALPVGEILFDAFFAWVDQREAGLT